jgi:uncharacterized protein YlxW (UPF0749 family)
MVEGLLVLVVILVVFLLVLQSRSVRKRAQTDDAELAGYNREKTELRDAVTLLKSHLETYQGALQQYETKNATR